MSFPGREEPKEGMLETATPVPYNYNSSSTNSVSSATVADNEKIVLQEPSREEQNEDAVLELARRLTSQSHSSPGELFPVAADGPLNPESPQFNAKKWAKAFYDLRTDILDGCPPKTTGIAFKNLDVYGYGTATDFQKSVGNIWLEFGTAAKRALRQKQERVDILHDLEGVVHSGEMLAVLGPPGSGCSTFLKTVAGETHGFYVSDEAVLNYQGIHPKQMRSAFRGECIYTAEVDHHFPHLTVGDTLYFAARARCPKNIPEGVTRQAYAEHLRDVTMAMFGISHTKNTRVGNDFVRGVSGGERKRVTIAEAALSYSPLQCWDNSTRGLDSANALEFCRTLRTQADTMGCTSAVAIYQASQDAYDVFDKVIVLYDGRQIFFGRADEAKAYFENLGFVCAEQQTTADFLTSMTSPSERVIRSGWEGKTPRTAEEFAKAWKSSQNRARLLEELDDYVERHPFNGEHYQKFLQARKADQAKSQRELSPYTLSYSEQVKLTLWRSWVMLKGDPSVTITMLIVNTFQALIISSVFFNLEISTGSFFHRGALLFFTVLMNALGSILEILTLYDKRKIIEKHNRYALYHLSAEALSSMIVDLPYKIVNALLGNTVIYFMVNLRREPGAFFFFMLLSFSMTLSMSMLFRTLASCTKSVEQAMVPSSVLLLAIALFTGFAIPPPRMPAWFGWIRWLNPAYYGLESVAINEFQGREFPCSSFVPAGPSYENINPLERACSVKGAVPGDSTVGGTEFISAHYGFDVANRWRNFGIIVALGVVFMIAHLIAITLIASERSKGEVLVFRRKAMKKSICRATQDAETGPIANVKQEVGNSPNPVSGMVQQTSVFHWKDVCYDVKVKSETRRILDNVDGWVKPGTLTALMGVSGAGKTTLLDVLASRVTMGVISGEMLVDGHLRDESFQRKTGYVTQQDLHLHTSTVREALSFSALLRQPAQYSKEEKLAYVNTVIDLLGMEEYADAVIGVPGEGLNVEQRKRLTIGVELAARPQLLLFLDEPTSGLDSQTSWSICNLMEKLTKSGQAILCTIHQPSAMLFQRFDRLLLLAKGGKTVYFGEVGQNSRILMDYFVRNGGSACPPGANPAEHMLEVIGAAPGAYTEVDWPVVWRQSPEYQQVQEELIRLSTEKSERPLQETVQDPAAYKEFAAPFGQQLFEVTKRVFQQYWRSPSYIYSKAALSMGSALFISLSFLNLENTQTGLQNQMFGIFLFLAFFGQVIEQIMPLFVSQRTMYEARERPSKSYSWKAFLSAQMLVEFAWNSLLSIFTFICWFYPMGLYRNAQETNSVHARSFNVWAQVWVLFVWAGTIAHMLIVAFESEQMAGALFNLMFVLMFTFCGVLAGPNDLPRFWIFMYRVNPFTYIIEGFLGPSIANASVHCDSTEFVTFVSPDNSSCRDFMAPYIATAGGYLLDPDAGNGADCHFCPIDNTNQFLASVHISFDNRWRNFGMMWGYVIFNAVVAIGIYWLVRVPKKSKVKKE
ncbi:ABC-2 type transporter [Paramyrothecium foliicola]|nr:ABC-2 type transporter [Paramyrothecium foliicola]